MGWLRERLDRLAPRFERGGRLHRWHPLWEAIDTFFYTPPAVTATGAHVRDAIDLKRMMMTVVIVATTRYRGFTSFRCTACLT